MKPKVSVCIPVYNVEPYIAHCVRSLFAQTMQEVEFIFVDDCSTDRSMELVDSLVSQADNKYVRLFYNEQNLGVAATRNRAIHAAMGDYVVCIDSDDYIDDDFIQTLYDAAVRYDADVVISDYIEHCGWQAKPAITSDTPQRVTIDDVITGHYSCSIWVRLIRKKLLERHDCLPPVGLDYMEDMYASYCMSIAGARTVYIPVAKYHYVIRPNSICTHKTEKHFECLIRFWQLMEPQLEEKGLLEKYRTLIAQQKIYEKARIMLDVDDNRLRRKYARLYAEEYRTEYRSLRRSFRLMSFLTYHGLWPLVSLHQLRINQLQRRMKRRAS